MFKRSYYIDNMDLFWLHNGYEIPKIMQTLSDLGADCIKSEHKLNDEVLMKVVTFKAKRKNFKIYENEFNRVFGSPFSFSVKSKNW